MSYKDISYMKTIDIVAATFLCIGGINWGLVGLFNFDLVAWLFGSMSVISRVIYSLVAVCAIYDAVMFKNIQRRWECRGLFSKPEAAAT